MTIHDTHPFADPDPDPVRRLRGRLGGAVTLWTTGQGRARAGLTVSSIMVANGVPARVLALIDPDSDLADTLGVGDRAVVQTLTWEHRDLADAFAGTAPAPGGPFRQASFVESAWGPRLEGVSAWAGVILRETAEVGWSRLLTCEVEQIQIDDDAGPMIHRRGRYVRLGSSGG